MKRQNLEKKNEILTKRRKKKKAQKQTYQENGKLTNQKLLTENRERNSIFTYFKFIHKTYHYILNIYIKIKE